MSQGDLREKEVRLLEALFAPVAVYVGVSLALAAILVTQKDFTAGANAYSYAVGCFLLSAVLFFFHMDFQLLSIWYEQHRTSFGIIISALYGLGQLLIPVGLSLSMLGMGFRVAAFVSLSVYVAGFLAFNIVRLVIIGSEELFPARLILRSFNFAVLLSAYIVIWKIGG